MATRRTDIQIVVTGLADLQAANSALSTHVRQVQRLTAAYSALSAVTGSVAGGITTINNDFRTFNTTTNTTTNNITNIKNSLNSANSSGVNFLGTLLKYRAASLVFGEVQKAVGAATAALYDMERQAARVQRVSVPGSTPGIRADFAVESARTGADIKDIGEAYYQLKTRITDNATAFAALQTAMNLVVGTEADARQTTRAMLQVYAQFGDQLDKNVGQAENFRRIGELLAGTWKLADAEMVDITNTLKYLGPIAEAAKVPLEQVFGTLTALTAEGHRGRMSGTEAGQFISQIIKNYNAVTGEIENKGAHVKVALTLEGGIDLQKTIENIVKVANSLPTEQARAFLLAISGTQNSFRFLGTTGTEFMHLLDEAISKARDQAHGLTHDAEDIRKTMGTTAQEGERVFKGMFSAISNMIDASPLRRWLHDVANDIQHVADVERGVTNTNTTASGVLGGQGFGVNPADNRRVQLLMQQSILRDVVNEARGRGLSGVLRVPDALSGPQDFVDLLTRGNSQNIRGLYDTAYAGKIPAERGYLQQFMQFRQRDLAPPEVTMNLPAMQAELRRVTAELASSRAPIGPADVPAAGSLGLHGLSARQAENAAIITAAAKKYGVDPLAMIAVANYESGLSATNKNATSTATGLFQILKSTAPGIDRSNPYQNAEFAARAIAQAGGRGLTGEEAIRRIALGFEKPDPPGGGHVQSDKEIAAAIKFYTNQGIGKGGAGPPGGYTDPKIEKAKQEAQRAADEAAKKQAELLDKRAKTAQIEYEHLKKQFGDDDARTAAASRKADALAASAGDADERLRLRYGLTGNVAGNREGALAEREKRAKDAEDAADKAKEAADKRRELYAAGGPDAGIIQTSLFPFPKELVEAFQGRPQNVAAVKAAKYAADEAEARQEAWATAQNEDVARLVASGDAGIRARERTLRPNLSGVDARQQSILEGTVEDVQSTIKMLAETFKVQTPETARELKNLQERLADANAALVDFNDRLEAQAYQRRIKSEQDAYELRAEDITHLHKLRFARDDEGAYRNKVQELSELLANAQGYVETVKNDPNISQEHTDRLRQAAKQRDLAQQNLQDYQLDAKIQRYMNVYQNVKGTVHDVLSGFLHGQGDLGTVAQGLGGTIVQASFDQFIKKYTDPLVSTITGEILAIQGNTDALQLLTSTVSGGGIGGVPGGSTSPFVSSVAAGVQAGIEDVGGGIVGGAASGGAAGAGKKGGASGQSDLQKGIGAGLAAYSIGATSAQQGVNAGNFLGGVISGASIGASFGPGGALIGGIVGGAVDLIGGLFHHKSTPTAQPRDLNPAYYNAPSAFDVAAYNYSAYGKLPRVQDVGFDVKPVNAPIVNVYVDGAKVAARMEISRQTTIATVSLSSQNMDRHAPV